MREEGDRRILCTLSIYILNKRNSKDLNIIALKKKKMKTEILVAKLNSRQTSLKRDKRSCFIFLSGRM